MRAVSAPELPFRHARVGYMGHLFLMAGALQEAASKWQEACAAAHDATVYNCGFIYTYHDYPELMLINDS